MLLYSSLEDERVGIYKKTRKLTSATLKKAAESQRTAKEKLNIWVKALKQSTEQDHLQIQLLIFNIKFLFESETKPIINTDVIRKQLL